MPTCRNVQNTFSKLHKNQSCNVSMPSTTAGTYFKVSETYCKCQIHLQECCTWYKRLQELILKCL